MACRKSGAMRLAARPWALTSGAAVAAARPPLATGATARAASSSAPGSDDPMGDLLELRSKLGKDNVKWLLPSYVDMHGVSKSKVVPLSHMIGMMGGSEMYTGAALDGVVNYPMPRAVLPATGAPTTPPDPLYSTPPCSLRTCRTLRSAASLMHPPVWSCPGSRTLHGSPLTSP